jgi:16S rRNA processing protein RimM
MAWIEIGWIGKPHGLNGAFLLTGKASQDSPLDPGIAVRLHSKEGPDTEQTLLQANWMPKGWKIRLSGIDSPEHAKTLHGTRLFIETAELTASGEFFPSELLGFSAWDERGDKALGTFDGIESLPAGPDRWWFKTGSHSWSVPATEHFIQKVDKDNQRIWLANFDDLVTL